MSELPGRTNWDVIIVGSGPAGLFASLSAAQEGACVFLLEKRPNLGGKLLLSGGGRGNLTHTGNIPELLQHYHGGEKPGTAGRFLRPALYAFSNRDLAEFFSERGLPLVVESDGRVFPKTDRAKDALNVILKELEKLRVEACTEMRVTNVRWVPSGFFVSAQSKRKETFKCRSLVLAAGGQAYPPLGSTDGYALARKLGHQLIPCRPALVPVIVKFETFRTFVECAGIAVQNALVILERAKRTLCKKQGPVLFTHRGLSGPAVLDLSREVEPNDVLRVIFTPGVGNFTALEKFLIRKIAVHPRQAFHNLLHGLGTPRALAKAILAFSGTPSDVRAAELPRDVRRAVTKLLVEGAPFTVAGVAGWDEAMVTRGGVALSQVDPKTMESRVVSGLFFAGEILDVDGESGGYNLQAAFSTGFLAGRFAARKARARKP